MIKNVSHSLFILGLLVNAQFCFGQGGISDDEILLGMSNALSGPTAQLGIKLKKGSQVYFDGINKNGGIHGRQVTIISLDDGYEPQNTVRNTRKLIFEYDVFALFGYVGTPTSFAIMPLLKKMDIPYLMPFTGAEFLREPVTNNIFNLRASYYEESKAQIDYLVTNQKMTKIGLLIQADEFGLAVEQGILEAMAAHGLAPLVTVRYRRNTEETDKVLLELKKSEVEAVSFVGTYEPFADFINTAFEQQFTPYFSSVSFVSSHDLFRQLKYPSKVLVTEVLPDPKQCQLGLCQKFNQAMQADGVENPDQIHFEGYLNAYIFSEAALSCGVKLSRECLMQKLKSFHADFQGISISFKPEKHQALHSVYFSFFQTKK